MKGLILCGGKGTRLRPLTYFKPKPMIEVGGKPVLEHIVEHLEGYGIKDILVNLHHKPWGIVKHFGPRLSYTYEPKLLGERGTINKAKDFADGGYLVVMNGDTLTNIDLYAMFEMSMGKSVQSVDNGVYTGTKILAPSYFTRNQRLQNYSHKDTDWIDIGTFKGLAIARKLFNEKTYSLPKLSGEGDQVNTWRNYR